MPEDHQHKPHAEFLELRHEAILKALITTDDQIARANLVVELRDIHQSQLAQARRLPYGPYSGFTSASDAAMAHMETVPRNTLSRENLTEAVLAGGWGPTLPNRWQKVSAAIWHSIFRSERIIERKDGKLSIAHKDKKS